MKLNGIDTKPIHTPKAKALLSPTRAYSRWESASGNGMNVTLHRQMRLAIFRAVQLRGYVRAVTYSPDGIVQHGEWRKV